MKSPFARFNMSPTRLEVCGIIALGAIFMVGLVGAGSSIFADRTGANADTAMSTASNGSISGSGGGGTGSGGSESGSRGGSTGSGGGSTGSGGGSTGSGGGSTGGGGTGSGGSESGSGGSESGSGGSESGSGGSESGSGGSESGSGGSAASPSTTTAVRTVKISMVVHRGQGNFSDVPTQPFRGVCHPDGIRREHEGGEPLWEEESGTVEFDRPLVLTFEVGADQQAWCAFYLQPHARWERVTDVSSVVNGSSHSAANVECLIPAPGESYRQTVEAAQYLPGRSDGCDVSYTIVH